MKAYEAAGSTYLTRRLPVVVRVDGRAFHTWVRRAGYERPFDFRLTERMVAAAHHLMQEMSNAVFVHTSSDEISVVMADDRALNTEPWFGNGLQKVVSVAASIATMAFNRSGDPGVEGTWHTDAMFDARAFTLPHAEVTNYLLWRQRDAERNCVSAHAQDIFGHKRVQGVSTSGLVEMLASAGVSVEAMPLWQRRGVCIRRLLDAVSGRLITVQDSEPPRISDDRDYVEDTLLHRAPNNIVTTELVRRMAEQNREWSR